MTSRRGFLALLLFAIAPSLLNGASKKKPASEPKFDFAYLSPAAAAPGKTTEITLLGGDFAQASGLWTSFPADVERLSETNDGPGVTFRLKLAADVPVGIGAVRVATPRGVSDLRLLMVDDLPSIASSNDNTSPGAAQVISPATAIDGRCEEMQPRFFRILAAKGQRISFEVVAQRLGSPLDPVMRLTDKSGREIEWADDSPGAGSDCRFSHVFDSPGDYLLELRDVNYGGGAEYRYRLRVGDFPIATTAFPLAGRRGVTTRFRLESAVRDAFDPIDLAIEFAGSTWLNARYPRGQGSAFFPVMAIEHDETIDSEPNDSAPSAAHITLPASISGRFDKPGDRDYYEFAASKGQQLSLRAYGRSLGLPSDPAIVLMAPDGVRLTETKPSDKKKKSKEDEIEAYSPHEPEMEVQLPSDGVYRVRVEELSGRGGPGILYRLTAEIVLPGFSLSVETDKATAAPGETFKIEVKCARRDYDGPITLKLTGDTANWAVQENTIAEKKSETTLVVTVPEDFVSSQPISFSIMGIAIVDGKERQAKASTESVLSKQFPRVPFLPPQWDGLIGFAVGEARKPD